MFKADDFILENGVRVIVLGDRKTNGHEWAMSYLIPPKGREDEFIQMWKDEGIIT